MSGVSILKTGNNLISTKTAVIIAVFIFLSFARCPMAFCQPAKDAPKTTAKAANPREEAAKLTKQALELAKKGEGAKALPLLKKAVLLDPKNQDPWLLTGEIHMALGKPQFAIATYQKALAGIPNSPHLWFNCGYAQGIYGQTESSIKSFDNAIKYDPAFSRAYKYKGYAQIKLNRFDDALLSFKKALALSPSDTRAQLFLGIAQIGKGQKTEGAENIKKALTKTPALKSEIPQDVRDMLEIK